MNYNVFKSNKIDILGTEWNIEIRDYEEDNNFIDCSAYCSYGDKLIVICNIITYPGWHNESNETIVSELRKLMRHEIIHAYLQESGLSVNSIVVKDGWARNEEMIDWWALQGPKVYDTWKEIGAI